MQRNLVTVIPQITWYNIYILVWYIIFQIDCLKE